jgi:competence ComEA-like helix-hairpin-helix protein
MFNRREKLVLLFLGASLVAGSAAALVDHYRPASLAEFAVIPGAAPAPVAPPEPLPASPAAGPALQTPPASPVVGKAPVRLNSATEAQLVQLPGIGPKMAARILKYRREHGSFKTIAALEQVPGIGPRILEKLRPLVVVD